ncbi:hypothetical protein [uncultured Ruegeria sp.]|uniref:hypothetical protein n=1 Tax=uncultured Ruegeria sp. TaxID=259304 RepID=UPI0026245AF5|nr:hypothetical protein [uncultured Ruegeria sp.]
MKRRWVWFTRQADQNNNAISVLATVETIASVGTFLLLIAFYDWGIGVFIGACLTPIFFLRSPESRKSTREYYERAVSRPHRFQLYGALTVVILVFLEAPIWTWIVMLSVGGYVGGHLFNAWYVQFDRSLRYFRAGLSHLSENYYTTLFATDITARPELFPESEKVAAIPHWETSIFSFPRPRNPVTFLLSFMATLVMIGVVLLRFAAKASALVCLPLVYLSWPSRFLNNHEEQLIWIKSQSAKSIELFRFALAITVVASLFLSIFDATKISEIQDIVSAENPARMLATLYYVTDPSHIKPWQYLSVASAVLSILLYLLMDGCRKEAIAGRRDFSWRVGIIVQGVKVRTLLLVSWLLVAGYFSLEFYYLECRIEDPLARILSYFWDEPTCAVQQR